MGKQIKTNAMRLLDAKKVPHESFHYKVDEANTDGTLVARMNGRDTGLVHKTLVAKSSKNQLFVFIIPINKELDLKKAAQACGEKKIEMLPHKDLLKYTGYIKGGCSPLGMKKLYPTYLEESSLPLGKVIVSGGKKGHIIEIGIDQLLQTINGQLKSLIDLS
ncbi:Cys-tRNA(Pro) deacylase [Carboxylicivirga sediminis]|uniref:Cys-tRNA(Pro)/Cys-tRNA(Cys) deacylase n=1 Tax=Carboxylicivirga sediminis TaxID=2006564 RepID=A0A941F359_9BACT|nr:Cys-tRNA(Pro) deacylase [Carboxylicivirga sediminis]MBR8534515.1 Cys-tRNA(Pro) deacylase [Carboxylicivirga sediminis]